MARHASRSADALNALLERVTAGVAAPGSPTTAADAARRHRWLAALAKLLTRLRPTVMPKSA